MKANGFRLYSGLYLPQCQTNLSIMRLGNEIYCAKAQISRHIGIVVLDSRLNAKHTIRTIIINLS